MYLDYNITAPHNLKYLQNKVTKEAQRFYIDRVKTYASTFEQVVHLIDEEYNYTVRKTRVNDLLNRLRVHDFIDVKTDAATGLEKVFKLILKI